MQNISPYYFAHVIWLILLAIMPVLVWIPVIFEWVSLYMVSVGAAGWGIGFIGGVWSLGNKSVAVRRSTIKDSSHINGVVLDRGKICLFKL